MLDENGDPEKVGSCMLCDSIGTVAGALTGTSTITTFVESSAGVAAGGRTGLASLVTAILFLLCLFVAPVAQMIPSCATAPALIYVGVLMMKNFAKVDMEDMRSAVPAFLTLAMMPLTYSIANGIGIGADGKEYSDGLLVATDGNISDIKIPMRYYAVAHFSNFIPKFFAIHCV